MDVGVDGSYRLALVERQAVGRWVAGGVEWFVDAEGVLFPSADPTAAPALRVDDRTGLPRRGGDRLDERLVAVAMRLAALAPGELRADMIRPRARLDAGANGLVLESGSRWEIRFGDPEAFDRKLDAARQFLRSERDRALDYVDVRSPERVVFAPR